MIMRGGAAPVRHRKTRIRLRPAGRCSLTLTAREFVCCIAMILAAYSTRPAFALDPRYPDWPCQQLKVPEISIASVWSGPPIEAIDKEKPVDPKEAELVTRLAARRTSMEDARKLIAEFVVGTDAEKQEKAKRLFAALYAKLNAQRDEVMNGIERFSRKLKAMAEDIREQARKMREMQDASTADPAKSNELASQLSWQTRIFEDRRKSTAAVCEVPVLIEKRLFDLASAIQSDLSAEQPAK